jgi:hypothetical protein
MRSYGASSTTPACSEAAWALLSNGAGWSNADSGIGEVEGRIEIGETGAATVFHGREEYTGPLLPPIWRSMPDLSLSFDRFAKALEWRVESDG